MSPEAVNTYSNLLLLIAVVAGVGFAVYRATRKKPVEPREVPKRPETFRPKTREDEDVYEEIPIRDWREKPTVSPMHTAVPMPPKFRDVAAKGRSVIEPSLAPKAPVMASRAPKSYKTASKSKASTGVHSPYRRDDDVDVHINSPIVSDSPRCDTPTHSGDSGGCSGGDSGGDGGGSISTD